MRFWWIATTLILLQGFWPVVGSAQEALLPAASPAGAAQEASARTATLQQLIERALADNPGVQAKRRAYEAARARVLAAWLPDDPELGVDVEGQSSLFRFDRIDNEYMLSQSVPFPTTLWLRGRVASRDAAIAFQRYRQEQRETAWHVEQPYYDLVVAHHTAAALEDIRMLLERSAHAAQARYESNRASQQDLLKTQIALSQTSVELFNWQQKAHLAQAHIAHVINEPLQTTYVVEERATHPSDVRPLPELEQLALRAHPELTAMALGIQRAKAAFGLAATNWLPNLTGRIEARQFSGEGSIREYDTFLGLTVPVWSIVKGVGGEWRAARGDVQEAEAMYAQMKNEVLLAIHEAYAKVASAQNGVMTYEAVILPEAKQQVEVALSAYEAGRSDMLALIDAQRTLKDTQVAYYGLQADYERGVSDLRLAVGAELPQAAGTGGAGHGTSSQESHR